MNLRRFLRGATALALASALAAFPAAAQTHQDAGGSIVPGVAQVAGTLGYSINTTGIGSGSATSITLPGDVAKYPFLTITNTGATDAFIAYSGATTSSNKLTAGSTKCVATSGATVSAITASSTTSIYIDQSNACLSVASSSSSGGGGTFSGTLTGPLGNATAQSGALSVTDVDPVDNGTGAAGSHTQRVAVSSDSVPSLGLVSAASMTRIANTTTYTVNTGWNTLSSSATAVFTFNSACRANAGLVALTGMDVWSSANPTTKLTGILWLFNASPATVVNDDATFNIAQADFANLTGSAQNGLPFTLAAPQGAGATNSGVSIPLSGNIAQCATGTTTLYGMVQVVNAYVPASGEVLHVTLRTVAVN